MLAVASREPSGEVVRLSAEHLARLPRVEVSYEPWQRCIREAGFPYLGAGLYANRLIIQSQIEDTMKTDIRLLDRYLTAGKFCILTLVIIVSPASNLFSQSYPLKISSNHRYLVDQVGTPFFLNGDAAWSMIVQLSYEQADIYLTDRAGRGFNTVMVNLIEKWFADYAPNNIHNVSPWTGAAFTTPNNAYFSLADSMLTLANDKGISVFLDPIYLGYGCTTGGGTGYQGWCTELKAASLNDIKTWGTYVGNRYKSYANIIWLIGGDADPDLSDLRAKLDTFAVYLIAADDIYPDRLKTGHARLGDQTTYFTESWMGLNGVYNRDVSTIASLTSTAYGRSPVKPVYFMEGLYENENSSTATILRQQMYLPVLRGAFGAFFGNCPIWAFGNANNTWCAVGTTWQNNLNTAGSQSATHFKNFFTAWNWWTLVPDNGTVLTSGAESGTTLAACAYASDSTCIIVYLPTSRTISINPSVLTGDSLHVNWFDPSSGVYSSVGDRAKSSGSYSPPTAGDWVLVIDGYKGTVVSPPSTPIKLTPINGAVEVPIAPTLTWNLSVGATSYTVQISTDSTFASTLIDQSGITDTTFSVSNLEFSITYHWRVRATNIGGSSAFSSSSAFTTVPSSTDVDNDTNSNIVPSHSVLEQNYPNPFNPSTEITFAIPTRSLVRIDIYDLLGRQIAALVDRELQSGWYNITWNGLDARGSVLPSGVYFYRLTARDFVQTRKMLLLK